MGDKPACVPLIAAGKSKNDSTFSPKLNLSALNQRLQQRLYDLCPGYLKLQVWVFSDLVIHPDRLTELPDSKVIENKLCSEAWPIPLFPRNLYMLTNTFNYCSNAEFLFKLENVCFLIEKLIVEFVEMDLWKLQVLMGPNLKSIEMNLNTFSPNLKLKQLLKAFGQTKDLLVLLNELPKNWEPLLDRSNARKFEKLDEKIRKNPKKLEEVFQGNPELMEEYMMRQRLLFDIVLDQRRVTVMEKPELGEWLARKSDFKSTIKTVNLDNVRQNVTFCFNNRLYTFKKNENKCLRYLGYAVVVIIFFLVVCYLGYK